MMIREIAIRFETTVDRKLRIVIEPLRNVRTKIAIRINPDEILTLICLSEIISKTNTAIDVK